MEDEFQVADLSFVNCVYLQAMSFVAIGVATMLLPAAGAVTPFKRMFRILFLVLTDCDWRGGSSDHYPMQIRT